MSTIVTLNSVLYAIPATGEDNWGDPVSSYLIALSTGVLSKSGGAFTLTAEVDLGANYGLKSIYLKSRGTNIATTGIVRMAVDEVMSWRNNANTADLSLAVDASDVLTYNSIPLVTSTLTDGAILIGSASNVATAIVPTGDVTISDLGVTAIGSSKVTNGMLAGSIAYSKLVLTGSVTNGDLAGSIAYSKLVLTGSVIDADIASGAAIAFSKLAALSSGNILVGNVSNVATSVAMSGDITISNSGVTAIGSGKVTSAMILDGTIVNADINASAAIVYSKLSLTGSVNLASDMTGTLPIANGGTGQTTANAALNAFLPSQTGNNGFVLTTNGSNSSWTNATGLTNPMTSVGDLIVGGTAGAPTRLAIGASGTVLKGGTTPTWASIANADVSASAAIVYSKLSLGTSILNSDISASAAIAYSKLSLTGSIVNADVSASAAIAYSKLNLATSIVNADISASAAIAGSKLQAASSSNTGTISYESTGSFSVNWIQNSIAHSSITVFYTKMGKSVTLSFNSNVNPAKGATNITAATAIPAALLPAVAMQLPITVMNNNAIVNSPEGLLMMDTSGNLTIRLVADNTSTFAATNACGMYFATSISYVSV